MYFIVKFFYFFRGYMNLSDNIFNVLIVDDSNFFRVTARKMIEDNFRVNIFEASNAFEAMRLLGNHPIDIILLDVNMPEVDGFKAAKIIKHQEKYADIPIIFCTAMPRPKKLFIVALMSAELIFSISHLPKLKLFVFSLYISGLFCTSAKLIAKFAKTRNYWKRKSKNVN